MTLKQTFESSFSIFEEECCTHEFTTVTAGSQSIQHANTSSLVL